MQQCGLKKFANLCCIPSEKKHCFNANDMILYAILTCAPELTQVSLIYHMEPTTKKWIKEKLKSKNGSAQKYW